MTFYNPTGANRVYTMYGLVVLFVVVAISILMFSKSIMSIAVVLGLFVVVATLNRTFFDPSLGVNLLFFLSFVVVGMNRIIDKPFGLAIDGLMVITWFIVFFKYFNKRSWSEMVNTMTVGYTIWLVYCLVLYFNPNTNTEAYPYAVRDLALKSFLLPPLLMIAYNKRKDYRTFIDVWFVASLLLGLYGAKQYWIGVFGFEQYWLDTKGAKTHVLFGEFVRMFSFLASANQFGSSQAHAGSVALIFAITEKVTWRKIFYIMTFVICMYGMAISGTRVSIVIPIVGIALYLFFSRNFKILLAGSVVGGVILYLLVFTFVLHSSPLVRRMRTTFDFKNDASYIVRMENRARLELYMSTRPYGGGIGSVGDWGRRFAPDSFLGSFPTDGQYVKIYAETGKIGLWLYVTIHLLILAKVLWIVWNIKDKKLRNEMTGLLAGVLAAYTVNHTSHFTGGLPTIVLNLFCIAFIFMSPKWDKGVEEQTDAELLEESNIKKIRV